MAGLGRKIFTRERATVADVQGYLMDQTVMQFGSPSLRNSKIPTPDNGMIAFLQDQRVLSAAKADRSWEVLAGPAFFATSGGGGTVGTSPTVPANPCRTPSLPAGVYDITASMGFTLSVSSNRAFTAHLFTVGGTTELASGGFYAFPAATGTASRTQEIVDRITLTTAAVLELRASASGTGGTQSIGSCVLRACRVG